MADKKKETTSGTKAAITAYATQGLELTDLFIKANITARELIGVPFAITGASLEEGVDGEFIKLSVKTKDGEIETTLPAGSEQAQRIVAFFQIPKNKNAEVTNVTFARPSETSRTLLLAPVKK